MVWNIAPECVSTIVLCIIWIYSRKGNIAPSLKNKVFQFCFLTTMLAMTSNIISTILIYQLSNYTFIFAWISNMIYFIATPLMGTIYYVYVLVNIYEHKTLPKWILVVTLLPAILYIGLIIIDPFTHWVFSITLASGYAQGPFISSTYIIFYLYCILSIVFVVLKRRNVDRTAGVILFSFPLIAGLVIIAQLLSPDIILSGSAATIALLMIYLYMQNKQISIDYLTKLANRQEFVNLLDWNIKSKTKSFHVLVVSLRDFKRVNDVYGQSAGDNFLIGVSDYLRKEFHLEKHQLFRYSGDEFAILLQDIRTEDIRTMATIIQNRMLKPWGKSSYNCLLYAAIGVVAYPQCATTKEDIINGIEFSINIAKTDTTFSNICFCTPEILSKVRRRQSVLEVLHDCLDNHKFELYYQPIYNIKTGKFMNAEALLRIPHSSIGAIYPDEFIPVAEESGLIIDITYLVLDDVCHLLQEIKAEGISIDAINVNFSTSQFMQPDLMEKVIAILKEHNVDGSLIKIEITESTLSENAETMLHYALAMNSYGIRLCLDDFGTGYSNTSSVLSFPIDTIKLDKSLIWSAMSNERSALVVKNLSKTFSDLDFTVLAEGVETKEQCMFVEGCDCSLIQGFLYSKPLPKDQFLTFLKEHVQCA